MPTQTDTGQQDGPGKQHESPHAQEPAGSSTGGGGNPQRDKAPVATSEAPKPEGGSQGGTTTGATGARGISSGLQSGDMKPTNERFAGAGRLDTPGAHSEPGSATGGKDKQG